MTIYKDSKRIVGTNIERIGASASTGGWKEIGRTTLGSTGDNIDVTGLADKRHLMFLGHGLCSSATNPLMVVGNGSFDSGNNYAERNCPNGGSDITQVNQPKFNFGYAQTTAVPSLTVGYFSNYATKEKLLLSHTVFEDAAGAGNAPKRYEYAAKWINTSNVIDQMRLWNAEGGSWDSGAELVVLGWDEDDTHSTNFWEELYSGSGTSLDTGVGGITAKKYLWIQTYIGTPTAGANHSFVFNGDTGSNYAVRYEIDGGNDGTDSSRGDALIPHQGGASETSIFANTFIVNNSANEKIIISHEVVAKGTGASSVPSRYEHAGKWANTSAQITDIALTGTYGSTSEMKIWGSN